MKTHILLISLLLFSSLTSVSAQENYLTLRGRVTDRDTREGLPVVTVYVAGQAIYTQTNNDGEYVLKVPSEHQNGSVVYALMGYLRDTVSIAKAQHKGDIALTSDGGRWLKEVNVTEYSSKSAAKLLMDAVNRIPQNYQTDSVVGTWFYRDVRMLNDELFLFDEMVFDALRVGYDKHHALRKLYNKTGPYGSVKLDYKRPIESNYTAIRHDRLLLCDTAYVNRVTNGIAGDKINYDESEVLYDPVEVPNTVPRLTVSKLKKAKNLRHYFMMYPYFPLKKVFKDAGVDSMANRSHVVYNYGMVEGKYTLTSYTRHEGSDLYCAKNSPLGERIQHLDKQCQCVLTNEHKEGASFLKNNTIQGPGSVLVMNRRADNKSYNEAFWQQYNFIPLETSIRQKLEKKLKKY